MDEEYWSYSLLNDSIIMLKQNLINKLQQYILPRILKLWKKLLKRVYLKTTFIFFPENEMIKEGSYLDSQPKEVE